MKCLVKNEPAVGLTLKEKEKPSPKDNEILIKVKKAAICGTDLHIWNWDSWAQEKIKPPMSVGHEFMGVIEEVGHPLDGQSIEDTILIYPKGSGSTVAPYVLMGLIYTGKGPRAIVNRDVCSLTLPACSLLDLPYSHGFEEDPCLAINDGDMVRVSKVGDKVTVQVLERVGE